MAKVVVAQPIDPAGLELLGQEGHDVRVMERLSPELLIEAVRDADGLLVRDAHVTAQIIAAGRRLQVIARHGAGLDRIDVAGASARNIAVTYTPVANSLSVAEHAVALILALAKNLMVLDPATRSGRFELRHQCYGFELSGRTLGILGLGRIGRRLARIAGQGFGMTVIAYDPYVEPEQADGEVSLEADWLAVVQQADVLSIHLPLTPHTRGLIDLDALRRMKPTALLVNCARGEIVVESDLVTALRAGVIAGAGIDVYDPDPPAPEHPLFSLGNVVVTPHTAAHTREAMRNMSLQAAQGIVDVLAGRPPAWPANALHHA